MKIRKQYIIGSVLFLVSGYLSFCLNPAVYHTSDSLIRVTLYVAEIFFFLCLLMIPFLLYRLFVLGCHALYKMLRKKELREKGDANPRK